jgi:hypothetical protein
VCKSNKQKGYNSSFCFTSLKREGREREEKAEEKGTSLSLFSLPNQMFEIHDLPHKIFRSGPSPTKKFGGTVSQYFRQMRQFPPQSPSSGQILIKGISILQ